MNDNGAYDRLSGKTKEVAGKVTDDKETETEGRLQQAEGRVWDIETPTTTTPLRRTTS